MQDNEVVKMLLKCAQIKYDPQDQIMKGNERDALIALNMNIECHAGGRCKGMG